MTTPSFILGTRSSSLAVQQTQLVEALLRQAWPDLVTEIKVYRTSGDDRLDIPCTALPEDAFTDQVEQALRTGEIHAAVHSYKDLPFTETEDLSIVAVPVRADPRDALVARDGLTLSTLPPGAVIGTSSERRGSAVLAVRPDLQLQSIRGPIDDRLKQLQEGKYDAVIFAVAGLERLNLTHHITEYFDVSVMPPAAGQGALAVQCRTNDGFACNIVRAIDDTELHSTVRAERDATEISDVAKSSAAQ